MAKKPNPKKFKARARRYFILLQKAKEMYRKADELAAQIGKALGGGAAIPISETSSVLVIDHFAKAQSQPEKYPNPTVYKPCGLKQFELEMR